MCEGIKQMQEDAIKKTEKKNREALANYFESEGLSKEESRKKATAVLSPNKEAMKM